MGPFPEQQTLRFRDARMQAGFTALPNWILKKAGLSPGAKIFYALLLSYAWQDNRCWPGQARLASDLEVTDRTIRNWITELKAHGLISVEQRGLTQTNVYWIEPWHDDKDAVAAGFRSDRKIVSGQERKPAAVQERNTPSAPMNEETKTNKRTPTVVARADARAALQAFGIAKATAERLAATYPDEYIVQKLDVAQWLVAQGSSVVAKNPPGYLRRAIEQDYAPPDQYQRADARAEERQRHLVALEARRAAEAQIEQAQAAARTRLRDQHPPRMVPHTSLTTEDVWRLVLDRLQDVMTAENFQSWLEGTLLVACNGTTAVIATPSTTHREWLRQRLDPAVMRELSRVLGYAVSCEYRALDELANLNGERREEEHALPSELGEAK